MTNSIFSFIYKFTTGLFSGNPQQLIKDPAKRKFDDDGQEIEEEEEPVDEEPVEGQNDLCVSISISFQKKVKMEARRKRKSASVV